MPPDRVVIDLLSSPEVVLPEARPPSITLPSKVLSYNAPNVGKGMEEWLVLSSDDDVVPASSIRVLRAKSPPTKEATSATSVFAKPGWDFGGLDGDTGEPIAKSTNGANIKLGASSKATESKNTECGASSTKTIKGANDFCFLEDDFDSTVNFDDSYVQSKLPPAKKRRTSESPTAKPMPLTSNNRANNATKPKPRESGAGYKRSFSNVEGSSKPKSSGMSGRTTSAPGLKRANTFATLQEDDPILFTSSPDPVLDAARRRREKAKKDKESRTDIFGFMPLNEDDEIQTEKTSKSNGGPHASSLELQELSEDSDGFLDVDAPRKNDKGISLPKQVTKPSMKTSGFYELEDFSDSEVSKPNPNISTIDDSSDIELPDINSIKVKSKAKPKSKVRSTQDILAKYEATKAKERAATDKEKAAKAKSDTAAAKKAAKEAEKEEKQRAKEKKAKEKQTEKELAAVNQLRTDKKLSTPEMIVDLPSCLENKLESQIHAFLDYVKVEYNEYSCLQPIVRWRRKVNADYDEEKDYWVPVNPYVKNEPHVMYVLSAKDFISLVQGEEGHDVNALMLQLRAKFFNHQIIFLMEGYGAWLRKNKGIKDKQFKEAVHSHAGPLVPGQNMYPSSSQTAKARKKVGAGEYIAEEKIEEALLKLQIEHDVYIHHTNVMQETAQWVKVFTENISSVPYKKQNLSTNFCTETGQIKTGEDAQDTFIKMLQVRLLSCPLFILLPSRLNNNAGNYTCHHTCRSWNRERISYRARSCPGIRREGPPGSGELEAECK